LDNIAAIQEQTNIDRRQINGNNSKIKYYLSLIVPYFFLEYYLPSIESENLFLDLDRPYDAPLFIRLSPAVKAIPEKPLKIIAEESIMSNSF
jgi:hypothetical protein